MSGNTFLIQLFLTFLIGSLWIFVIVSTGARFGSKVSGFIAGLPSTALLSFFFIGLTQSTSIASEAVTAFPLALGATGMFLVVYAWLTTKRGFVFSLTGSICAWFVLSALAASLNLNNFYINLIIFSLFSILSFFCLEKGLKIQSIEKGEINFSGIQIMIRSIFGGTVIMLAVLFAKLGGPLLGGIFAAFPAMFISTLTISYQTYGISFSRAMTKPLLITGLVNITVYVISIKYLYLITGLYSGTLIAIMIASISAFFTHRFIQNKTT